MKTKIISYYSDIGDNTYYSDHAKRLEEDLQHFGCDYEIVQLESHNNYRLNCLRKPHFILEKMHEHKRPILWLDVDSYVHRNLNLFDFFGNTDYDLIYTSERADWGPIKASPLYLPYRERTIELVEDWVESCNQCVTTGKPFFDHEVLLDILKRYIEHPAPDHQWKPENPIKCLCLGREFCTWPQFFDPSRTVITMGISDGESKEQGLIDIGVDNPDHRRFQLIGKVDQLNNLYYDGDFKIIVSDFPGNFPNGNPMVISFTRNKPPDQLDQEVDESIDRLDKYFKA